MGLIVFLLQILLLAAVEGVGTWASGDRAVHAMLERRPDLSEWTGLRAADAFPRRAP